MTFTVDAVGESGSRKDVTVEAQSVADALEKVKQQGLRPLCILKTVDDDGKVSTGLRLKGRKVKQQGLRKTVADGKATSASFQSLPTAAGAELKRFTLFGIRAQHMESFLSVKGELGFLVVIIGIFCLLVVLLIYAIGTDALALPWNPKLCLTVLTVVGIVFTSAGTLILRYKPPPELAAYWDSERASRPARLEVCTVKHIHRRDSEIVTTWLPAGMERHTTEYFNAFTCEVRVPLSGSNGLANEVDCPYCQHSITVVTSPDQSRKSFILWRLFCLTPLVLFILLTATGVAKGGYGLSVFWGLVGSFICFLVSLSGDKITVSGDHEIRMGWVKGWRARARR